MEVKYNIVLLLAIAVNIYCVSANCPIDPKGEYTIYFN